MTAKYSSNWVNETEKDIDYTERAKQKAKRLEEKRVGEGWRWIKITPRTTAFVPCDKNGKPTKDGKRIIENMKKLCI